MWRKGIFLENFKLYYETDRDRLAQERILVEDRSKDTESSFFANWEVISTVPRSRGKDFSFKDVPYKSRVN